MSATRGWIGDPSPVREYRPGEEHKWRQMMGSTGRLPDDEERSATDSGPRD